MTINSLHTAVAITATPKKPELSKAAKKELLRQALKLVEGIQARFETHGDPAPTVEDCFKIAKAATYTVIRAYQKGQTLLYSDTPHSSRSYALQGVDKVRTRITFGLRQ